MRGMTGTRLGGTGPGAIPRDLPPANYPASGGAVGQQEQESSTTAKPEAPIRPEPPCVFIPGQEPESRFPTQFARLFFGVITVLVLYYSYAIIKSYLVDIFLALVVFFTAKPLYRVLTRLLFGQRALASALTCLILALLIIVPLVTLVGIVAKQALEFSSLLGQGMQSGTLGQWLNAKLVLFKNYSEHYLSYLKLPLPPDQIKVESLVQTILTNASKFVYSNAIAFLSGFTTFILDLALILFVTFFLFLQGDDFIGEIKKLSPLSAADNEMIVSEMEATIKATLWSTVVVAFIQGFLGGLAFFLFGVPQAAFWGTVMVPASVIPVVGASIIWVPGVIYLFLQGNWTTAIGLLLFCGIVIGMIDNLLRPMLLRGTRSTPTVLVLLAILGGISYFGMIGFILGPFILSLLLSLLSIYEKAILAPAKAQEASLAATSESEK
uniref:AI-2E family transporter n=1 Tax=Desulfobacca acetoxidans TaxID=60893 RepID=A0A7V6A157_9BACT